jgi:hypothetical protein
MSPRLLHREDHISQVPALQLLQNMGWQYVSPDDATTARDNKKVQMQRFLTGKVLVKG